MSRIDTILVVVVVVVVNGGSNRRMSWVWGAGGMHLGNGGH